MKRSLKIVIRVGVVLVLVGAAVWTVWNVVASRRLAAEIAAARTAGLYLRVSELPTPQVPPQDNGAPLYLAAFELAGGIEGFDEAQSTNIESEQDVPDSIARLLPRYDEVFDLLRRAGERPACAFLPPERFDAPQRNVMPALMLGKLLDARARLRVAEGDVAGAEQDVRTLFDLARAMAADFTLISGMVSIAIDGYAVATSRRVIVASADPRGTLARLDAFEPLGVVADGIREEAMAIEVLEAADMNILAVADLPLGGSGLTGWWSGCGVLLVPYTKSGLADYVAFIRRNVSALEGAYPEASDAMVNDTVEIRHHGNRVARLLVTNLAPMAGREAQVAGEIRLLDLGARALAHHKTHGEWPASLADLGADAPTHDPFSAKPFELRRDGESLVIASPVDNGPSWTL